MGEQTILVCDVCGKPAAETVTIRVGRRNMVKDFCSTHLAELTAGSRAPRRGRRKAIVSGGASTASAAPRRRGRPPKSAGAGTAAPRRRGRPPKSASAKKSTGRKTGARKSTGRRRGRPRKAQSQASS